MDQEPERQDIEGEQEGPYEYQDVPLAPRLSVIICTYNRADLLQGALLSLDDQFYKNLHYEIVVIDDGSTDDTTQVVSGLALKSDLIYVKMPKNKGRAAARNVGLKNSRGDYVLFVDDDILAPPDLLDQHMDWHKGKHKVVVRGPIKNTPDYEIPENPKSTWRDYSTAMFCTCNVSTTRFGIIKAGGFDETFVEYGFEDNELGWRLRQTGYTMRFNPKAIVYHYKPALSEEQLQDMMRRAEEMGRSAVAYFKKHPHWKVRLATGINPLYLAWHALTTNQSVYAQWLKMWGQVGPTHPKQRARLEERIFKYHYVHSLKQELKKMT